MNFGEIIGLVQIPDVEVSTLVCACQKVGVSMGKRHVLNGPHEPLEKGTVVGVLLDHPEDIARAPLQDIRQVVVVAGHQVTMVIREFPVLISHSSNLHLYMCGEYLDEILKPSSNLAHYAVTMVASLGGPETEGCSR